MVERATRPACHALHYLQVATELLGKAHAWKDRPQASTHRAFVDFLHSLAVNRNAMPQAKQWDSGSYSGRNPFRYLRLIPKDDQRLMELD